MTPKVVLLALLAFGCLLFTVNATETTEEAVSNAGANAAAGTEVDTDADTETAVEGEVQADTEIESEAEMEAEGRKRSRPINCLDAKVRGATNKAGTTGSGVYRIKPLDGGKAFDIYCDMTTDGGGWNVFQRRFDGSVNFYRGWNAYKKGFGKLEGEHWLGLDKINRLSKTMPHRLRIDLTSFNGVKKWGSWRTFMVDDEAHKYTLTARGFRDGGIGNSMSYHSGRPFSTFDRDNDSWKNNCASYFHGAWWYGACHHSNLNGKWYAYPGKHPNNYADGADWMTYRGHFESNKKMSMKFK